MAMGSARRRPRLGSVFQSGIVGVAACALALAFASRAFTSGPFHNYSAGKSFSFDGHRASAQQSYGSHPQITSAAGRSRATWQTAGFLGLVLASACRALTLKRAKGAPVAVRNNNPRIVLHGVPTAVRHPVVRHRQVQATCDNVAQNAMPEVAFATDLLQATDEPRANPCSWIGASPVATSAVLQASFVGGSVPESSPAAASPSTRLGAKARRVGSARCKSARRASSNIGADMAEKAARRNAGAKIQKAHQPAIVVPPSFDASRVRTKLQLGLRSTSRVCTALARETSTPSATVGTSRNTRMFLQEGRCASDVKCKRLHLNL